MLARSLHHCSFLGNPSLCGYWLSSPCHASRPAQSGEHLISAAPSPVKSSSTENHSLTEAHPPLSPASVSKAAILGIALGGLFILLMILVAACRPYSQPASLDGCESKPGRPSSPASKPIRSLFDGHREMTSLSLSVSLSLYQPATRRRSW